MGARGPLPDRDSDRAERRKGLAKTNGELLESVQVSGHPQTVPEAPADLRAPGLQTWARVWAEPQMTNGDYCSIQRLARLEDEAADLRSIVAEDGMNLKRPVQSARGDVVGWESYPHPSLRELRRIGQEAGALCRELGLTPAARARLGLVVVEVEAKADFVDELRKQRAERRGEPDPASTRRWS